MPLTRQDEATRRAARAQLRRAIREELAGRNDVPARRRRTATLLRQVRRMSRAAS